MLRTTRQAGCKSRSDRADLADLLFASPVRYSRRDFLAIAAAASVKGATPTLPIGASDYGKLPIFTEITRDAGITWQHFSGASPDRFLIEAMGGGVAFVDFDQDGLLDIFFVNGGETPRTKSPLPIRNALYKNLGNGQFKDVSVQAGVDTLPFYGMGIAVADYDNDGFPDLFITGYPSCCLFHNNGDGTFSDATERSGVKNAGRWATGATWFDYDCDGFLDLLVCNYAHFSFLTSPECKFNEVRTYCEQRAYEGLPLALFHNNRDGTFTDVSRTSGVDQFVGRALGVSSIDVNHDGWPDLFVARDGSPNLLLLNNHDGTFTNRGLEAEIAYDDNGNAKAGMGVDTADIDGDGNPDFVVTNFNYEFHSLFLNRGDFPFQNWTAGSRLAAYTRANVGWGVHFIDYDNDGIQDLLVVNGHIDEIVELAHADVKYKQQPLLLHNDGNALFENVGEAAGQPFVTGYNARGLAIGDFDNDGASDVVFTCLDAKPVLLRNNIGHKQTWIGIHLVGTRSNRDAIGAKLILKTPKRRLVRWITGGSSYLSSHDKRVIFGLSREGQGGKVSLEIRWPSGAIQQVQELSTCRYHTIREDLK